MTAITDNLAPGRTIGGSYRLDEILARGGFGVVWGAQHVRTGQQLAVKVLDAQRAALRAGAVDRFMREAQITAALRHPNTIRVFDVGGDGTPDAPFFLVMERLYGPTLEQVLRALNARNLTMSETTAIDLALPILGSLAEAHAAGLVHRDLKPGNIMLNEVVGDKPVVKVLDFGCSYVRGSELTIEGNVFGTPGYMSPEQIVGDPIDARTDLFALGLVLYRAITGRAPFIADENLALLFQYSTKDIPSPQVHADREISKPLVDAMLKSLARKRDDRFPDAARMRSALQNVRDAVRAAARKSRGGRVTMVGGNNPDRHGDGLSALVRLVKEVEGGRQWTKEPTESDVSGVDQGLTAVFVGEIEGNHLQTSAMSKLEIDSIAQPAEQAAVHKDTLLGPSTPAPAKRPGAGPRAPSALTPESTAALTAAKEHVPSTPNGISRLETETYRVEDAGLLALDAQLAAGKITEDQREIALQAAAETKARKASTDRYLDVVSASQQGDVVAAPQQLNKDGASTNVPRSPSTPRHTLQTLAQVTDAAPHEATNTSPPDPNSETKPRIVAPPDAAEKIRENAEDSGFSSDAAAAIQPEKPQRWWLWAALIAVAAAVGMWVSGQAGAGRVPVAAGSGLPTKPLHRQTAPTPVTPPAPDPSAAAATKAPATIKPAVVDPAAAVNPPAAAENSSQADEIKPSPGATPRAKIAAPGQPKQASPKPSAAPTAPAKTTRPSQPPATKRTRPKPSSGRRRAKSPGRPATVLRPKLLDD